MDSLLNFLLLFYGPRLYALVFGILLACGFGLPIPEDITLFLGGYFSYLGFADIRYMLLVCLGGVLFGDSAIFLLGRFYGRRIAKKPLFRSLLSEERLNQVQGKFHEKGNRLIFAARFMPGLRAAVFFSAGTLHLPFRIFFFYDGLAAILSVPLLVMIPYHFGDEWESALKWVRSVEHGIAFLIFGLIFLFLGKWYWKKKRKASLEGS